MAKKSLVALAMEKQEFAKRRVQELTTKMERMREELASAEKEATGWIDFLMRAEALANDGETSAERNGSGREVITVQKESLPGRAAVLIREKGAPMDLSELVKAINAQGVGVGEDTFRGSLNSALWRRQKDLFKKTDEGYELRTKDFVIVD